MDGDRGLVAVIIQTAHGLRVMWASCVADCESLCELELVFVIYGRHSDRLALGQECTGLEQKVMDPALGDTCPDNTHGPALGDT